jgi:glycosyltransferase involved in cell wall biosynthesis
MKISIVIPTYNEEKYLPKLLQSIKKQDFKDYEVIVADAFSVDKTRKIAKKHGAKVVDGGLPAFGRNAGAKIARGEYIYFLDADVVLPKNFLSKTYNEIRSKDLDIATCPVKPVSPLEVDKIMHNFANIIIKLSSYTKTPYAPGFCIMVKRALHRKIKGFNEKLKLREDHDYVRRAIKHGKFGVIDSTHVNVSVRRLKKEGRINLAKKYFMVEFYNIINSKKLIEKIEYEFGNFNKRDKSRIESLIIKLELKLRKVKNYYMKKALKERISFVKKLLKL